ncbi:MAG: hypothetical protein L0Y62_03050 [Nitrospirae bacterium]|nr:hypothetical protein [Nitrospirota bacterium]
MKIFLTLDSLRSCRREDQLKKNESERVHIPSELLWDYKEAPNDLLWRLQRLADFFPAYGADKEIVDLLFEHRNKLRLEMGKYELIAIYKEAWDEKTGKRT